MLLFSNVESLPKTSAITIKKLKSLGINNFFDLLNYYPFRYDDYSIISKIKDIQPGETVTIIAKVKISKYQITRTGLKIQVFILDDETGEIEVGFYNQPYLLRLFKKGMTISVAGTVEKYGKKITLIPKEYEVGESKKHTGRLIPVYPEKRGLSSRTLREKISLALESLKTSDQNIEILPDKITLFNNLIDEKNALFQIHFPDSLELAANAKKRLAFDELFMLQFSSFLVKKEWEKEKVGHRFYLKNLERKVKKFINELPFKLTKAQDKVWQEILVDIQKKNPMNRLLQGDVGSGKTVVAALACYLSYLNGFVSLLMAPTEILALQHFKTLTSLFKNSGVKIGLQTANKKILESDIVVGTHALISKKFQIKKVGLVVIDEQHRFGVSQRSELKQKGLNPHLLTMTATPIPRTVALTLYGELDFSVIDEMPIGRLPVKTYFIPKYKRSSCYEWIKTQVTTTQTQVFIVCPLIEESETETLKSIRAAKKEYENLQNIFSNLKLGLLHGKMKSKEKEDIMEKFKNKQIDILVSTPVVEVGVDIQNATTMLIEGAERFGLAQLHQLRGRVGRGLKQSYCFLFSEKELPEIIFRLQYFSKTLNGNKLAEKDLEIRGPGNIYGVKQHGFINLKIASLTDYELIKKTKNALIYFNNHFKIEDFKNLKNRLEKFKPEEVVKN